MAEVKDVWIKKKTTQKRILEMTPACGCDACSKACEYSSGFLAENDLQKLAKFLHLSIDDVKNKHLEKVHIYNKSMLRPKLEKKKGMPHGKCTFYEKGVGCKIHPAKPLHCKIAMNCKEYGEQLNTWFYLNHVVDDTDPEAIRQWAVFLETHPTIPGGTLQDMVPDPEKLKDILSYKLLR
jgi:Fe-S-cluster containining protein